MLTPEQIDAKLERVLLRVQKPGRYVGGELNQVQKNWRDIDVHIALAFPDIYDIGVSNLGLSILYEAINNRADALAERTYLPWLDMEAVMREHEIPLYSLESKHALVDFNLIGISLPYETLYTNALNLLNLADIPLRTNDRNQNHPIIIAGGHACFNPEPMAAFIDAFVIGEGEEVIHEIIDRMKGAKNQSLSRYELLAELTKIQGIYVPSLYETIYHSNGTIAGFRSKHDSAAIPIVKRITGKLPPPPTHFIVPAIETVHNRISVEIMRGCTRGCRFCHAGMITRPVRERPVSEIIEAIDESIKNTGIEEVALLSLSSSDYSQIIPLIEEINKRFCNEHLTISLPSLRIETSSVDLFEKLRSSRQGSFTLAPEAATDRMRGIINKPISEEMLLETAQAIYSRGWHTLKLYFMVGHPWETLDDVKEIARLCKTVLSVGRRAIGRRAALHVGVSTFVPKPHTPFQWAGVDSTISIIEKQRFLKKELVGPGVKLNWTDPQETMLEAWLSLGDRRMGEVIYHAYQNGAHFDAWQDQFNQGAWKTAFDRCGLDPSFYTSRVRQLDEILPWDHINPGVSKEYLLEEYQLSIEGKLREDCRVRCYACGILPTFRDERCQNPGPSWSCPEVARKSRQSV